MRRIHFIEIMDQPWCPSLIRIGITDFLRFIESAGRCYHPIFPRLKRVLKELRPNRIIDLCSGGGGPWPNLHQEIEGDIQKIILTDLSPNVEAYRCVANASLNRIDFCSEPVDATNIPLNLTGFRTLFSSFHHFSSDAASSILSNAVKNRQGIMIFEMTRRCLSALFMMSFTPVTVILATPFIRPFRWSRLLWTYVIPLIPLVTMIDGMTSCLRTYSPDELQEMIKKTEGAEDYFWEIGIESAGLPTLGITYLIGYPKVPNKGIENHNNNDILRIIQ